MRQLHVDYTTLLRRFQQKELQTKCKALARYRYRRPLLRFEKHQIIYDKLVMSVANGKAIVYLKYKFGGYK